MALALAACRGSDDPVCGDGVVAAGERCDDGNTTDGDGCSSTCVVEGNDACAPNPCLNGATCATTDTGVACTCAAGFSGPTCATNVDDCAAAPCLNGGTCTDGIDAFTCACAAGFTGDTCATNIDDCAAAPCLNGGTCTDGVNAFTCACASGFSGDTCATNIDDCAAAPCLNGGTCVDGLNAFTCQCAPGFSGSTCANNIDECAAAPCLNGGTCTDGINAFTCACAAGFSGATCATNIDECASAPCLNGGTCTDGINAFTCACAAGFSGATCATNIDDCASAPCLNGGTCVDGVNAFTCQCAPGFSGTTCATNINDCAPNPCLNGGTCTDRVNGFTCACTPHYIGSTCSTCATDRGDCNGLAADGCETNLENNAQHCNACNAACGSGTICSNRICRTPPPAPVSNTPVSVPAMHSPAAPTVADLNRDGILDVLVANQESGSSTAPSGSVSVFFGQAGGTLQSELNFPGAPQASNAVVAADVDGDGWLDAITVNGQTNLPTTNGSISVYRNLGASAPGTFGALATYTTGSPGSVHLCAADFNGDGRVDVATTSVTSNQVSVMLGLAAGAFGTPSLISIVATGGVQSTIGCRDLNGDGKIDLVVTSPSSARLSVLLGQGDGTFSSPIAYTNAVNGQTAGLAFGDADGDGTVDILSNGAAGAYLFFFKGSGTGTFASGVQSATGASAVANSALGLVTGDFTSDGKLDAYMLVTTPTGGIRPMTGSGTGTFTSSAVVNTGASPALNAIATADLDGDGYADLVLTNRGSSTVTVVLNGL